MCFSNWHGFFSDGTEQNVHQNVAECFSERIIEQWVMRLPVAGQCVDVARDRREVAVGPCPELPLLQFSVSCHDPRTFLQMRDLPGLSLSLFGGVLSKGLILPVFAHSSESSFTAVFVWCFAELRVLGCYAVSDRISIARRLLTL